jgi:hypothetical protein
LAPGRKFRFFYKASPPRDCSSRVAEELAEARNYLEMGKVRERSSRSDRVLGAAIFVGCSTVLAWLLMSSASYKTDKPATAAAVRPVVATQGAPHEVYPQKASAKEARPAAEVAPTVAQLAPAPANPAPQAARRSEPRPLSSLQAMLLTKPAVSARHIESSPSVRASTYDTPNSRAAKDKAEAKVKVIADSTMAAARPSEGQAHEREAPDGPLRPAIPPAASTQHEWTARSSAADDAVSSTVLRDWAAQQRQGNATTRANTNPTAPAPPNADWNAHMTQRRITDNATAFESSSAQN